MKIGLLGLGSIGKRHAANLFALGEKNLIAYDTAVWDQSLNDYPHIDTICCSIEEFWKQKPEAVLISTPPSTHHALATEVLTRGIHCFIEKPIGPTAFVANDLLFLNDDRKTLAVGYQLNASASVRAFSRDWTTLLLWDKQNMNIWPASTYERDLLLEFSHELALALLWAGATPISATAIWDDPENCTIRLGWSYGRRAEIQLSSNYNGYLRGAWSDHDTWEFSKKENDECYLAELEAFLAGDPYCTGYDALAVMQLIERLR